VGQPVPGGADLWETLDFLSRLLGDTEAERLTASQRPFIVAESRPSRRDEQLPSGRSCR